MDKNNPLDLESVSKRKDKMIQDMGNEIIKLINERDKYKKILNELKKEFEYQKKHTDKIETQYVLDMIKQIKKENNIK